MRLHHTNFPWLTENHDMAAHEHANVAVDNEDYLNKYRNSVEVADIRYFSGHINDHYPNENDSGDEKSDNDDCDDNAKHRDVEYDRNN